MHHCCTTHNRRCRSVTTLLILPRSVKKTKPIIGERERERQSRHDAIVASSYPPSFADVENPSTSLPPLPSSSTRKSCHTRTSLPLSACEWRMGWSHQSSWLAPSLLRDDCERSNGEEGRERLLKIETELIVEETKFWRVEDWKKIRK